MKAHARSAKFLLVLVPMVVITENIASPQIVLLNQSTSRRIQLKSEIYIPPPAGKDRQNLRALIKQAFRYVAANTCEREAVVLRKIADVARSGAVAEQRRSAKKTRRRRYRPEQERQKCRTKATKIQAVQRHYRSTVQVMQRGGGKVPCPRKM